MSYEKGKMSYFVLVKKTEIEFGFIAKTTFIEDLTKTIQLYKMP
jgi:hypothetical protein